MPTKIGSDYGPASPSGLTDALGNPLVSADTDGGTTAPFGPAIRRMVLTGVSNGDFEVIVPDSTAAVSAANPIPYWTWTAAGSSLTTTMVADAYLQTAILVAASSGTLNDSVTFTQLVPVPIAAAQSRIVVPVAAVSSGTAAGALTFSLTATYLGADGSAVADLTPVTVSALSSALTDPTNGLPTDLHPTSAAMGQLPRATTYVQVDLKVLVTTAGTADEVYLHDVRLEQIPTAIGVNATYINVGQLTVGGSDSTEAPDSLVVLDDTDREIGTWGPDGLVATDPDNANRAVRILDGAVDFTTDGGVTWATGLQAEGVVADAIRTGQLPGGHNAIPNASFELASYFAATAYSWPSSANFTTYYGTPINVTGTTTLSLGTATY